MKSYQILWCDDQGQNHTTEVSHSENLSEWFWNQSGREHIWEDLCDQIPGYEDCESGGVVNILPI